MPLYWHPHKPPAVRERLRRPPYDASFASFVRNAMMRSAHPAICCSTHPSYRYDARQNGRRRAYPMAT